MHDLESETENDDLKSCEEATAGNDEQRAHPVPAEAPAHDDEN